MSWKHVKYPQQQSRKIKGKFNNLLFITLMWLICENENENMKIWKLMKHDENENNNMRVDERENANTAHKVTARYIYLFACMFYKVFTRLINL